MPLNQFNGIIIVLETGPEIERLPPTGPSYRDTAASNGPVWGCTMEDVDRAAEAIAPRHRRVRERASQVTYGRRV